MWACLRETQTRPGTPDSGWRLAVKSGKAGADHHEEIREIERRISMLEVRK